MIDAAENKGGAEEGPDTSVLVKAAQSGDREAFGALYSKFGPMVNGILLAHAPREEVPDLVQDVFLHAMSRIGSVRDPHAFGGWLAQVARNMARMKTRSKLKLVELKDSLAGPVENSDEGLDRDRVFSALQALPESYRETLMLRLVEGMSGMQISARTGLTTGSVRVNLHRGMQMLRQKLGEVS